MKIELRTDKSAAEAYLYNFVRMMVISGRQACFVLDEINKLKKCINDFKSTVHQIVEISRSLLNSKEINYKRLIHKRYEVDQLYALNKLVEISIKNNQHLKPNAYFLTKVSLSAPLS